MLVISVMHGWGGGIRTPECQDQNLVPYHLATPHYAVVPLQQLAALTDRFYSIKVFQPSYDRRLNR